MMFMWTLSFQAANLNTLEGCVHIFTPYNAAWADKVTLATGTEVRVGRAVVVVRQCVGRFYHYI